MAKLVVEEQKDYPTLPPDAIIRVRCQSTEIRTVKGQRGDWDKIEFTFEILEVQSVPGTDHPSNYGGLIGEKIYGSTSTKLTDSQENKLRLWSEALLNRPLELGFELDTDYFLGRECRALVSNYEKKSINPVTQKPFVAHQVQSLMPIGGTGGVVPGSAPQQAPQQAPSAWGQPQQQAPAQDPWAGAPAPQAGDPWATPQQPQQQPQYAQAPAQQPAPQQYQQPAPQQNPGAAPGTRWDDEPGF